MTIDMKNFAGELSDPAAGGHVGSNSYQTESQSDEFPVHQDLLSPVEEQQPQESPAMASPEAIQEPSRQELNFAALREEVDRIKAERDEFRQNLDLLRANVQQQAPKQEPKKFLDGLSDNDVPNVAEIRSAFEQREAEYQMRLEELQVQQNYSDYAEVLEKYTAPLLRQKPHLAEGILGSKNKALFAYELGKMAQGQQKMETPHPQATPPSQIAKRIIENSKKPATLAQAGGQTVLGQADYYANMSDNEFLSMAAKNLGEI